MTCRRGKVTVSHINPLWVQTRTERTVKDPEVTGHWM